MVGVLAMAAAAAPHTVKDYEIEACKKRRKDDDRSSCETITKYLSPIGKTGDRVLSPPKSSNILHYFRKTSPTNKKTQSGKKYKIKSSAPLSADSSKECKIPLEIVSNIEFKKRGKRVNLSHNFKTENESPILISSDDSKEDCSLNNDFVENSTSVSFYKKHVEVLAESIQDIKNQSSTMTSKKSSKKVNPKQGTIKNDCKKLRKRKRRDVIDLCESLPLAEELNLLKKDVKNGKQIMPSPINEIESTANDANSKDNRTKTAQLKDGTITVSYEEFLKSHKENKLEQIPDSTMSMCIPSETARSGCISDTETCEISQQVLFKTVTVLAQVHPIPPKKKGRIPSIFLKQKQLEMENSLSDPENEQTVQKRKSNVVICEEELELAVLEAGSPDAVKPKCTLEERQQFMKAFRQPVSDALKNGVKKPDKQKELNEKSLNEEGRGNNSKKIMENPNTQMVSNNGNSQSHTDKGSFPKEKSKKLKKKDKKMLDTGTTPGENREGNTQKKKTFSFKDKRNKNRLGMNLRHKNSEVFRNSPLFNSESLLCEDRANDDPLQISSLCNNKSSRKTSTPIKDKVIHSKADTEDSLGNVFTPKSTRRSARSSSTPTAIITRGTDSGNAPDGSPVKPSTPKAANVAEKHSLYTAELLTIPCDSESPIRMKFTRISIPKKSKKKSKKRSKKSEATDGDFTSQPRKAINTSKRVSKAKRLIENAKALHISRSKAAEEIVTPLRRSSRHQSLPERKKMSDTEDSVIIIDSSPTSLKHPETNQKKLQCLNDVLGKKPNKTPKNVPGKMKVAPLFLTRKDHKTAEPILGFDESSQGASERSQDCDEFKAKRDFLMSGLPDLLKRQIAKKATALDMYNAVSASFQRVVHVQQKDDGCHLWHLKSPTYPFLTKLKELNTKVIDLSKCVIALGEFSTLDSNLKSSNSAVVLRGRRKDFTEEERNLLLEEIRWSNPEFSLKKYFPLLLKKQTEHQVPSECHHKPESPELKPDVKLKETKRKRVETENHKSKRKKLNEYSESPKKINCKPKELNKRNNSTGIKLDSSKGLYSKTSRKKQTTLSITCKVETEAEDSGILQIDDDKESTSEISSLPDSGTEDMLWTEKYQPQNASELVGNELAIKKLHSWLKDWKRRAELEEKQNLKGKRDEKQEDLLDRTDFKGSSDEEENRLCNTVLITGPTGVGKTAAVYACAQELGFKIFEVNASSQRSGRQILSQLKEATQSHQVDKQGVNSQKPCFFNSYNLGKSPKKLSSPKKVVTSPRKLPPPSPQSSGPKRALPPKTLVNYFKVSSKPKNNEEIGELLENNKGIKTFFEQKQIIQTKSTNTTNSNVKEFGAEEPSKKNATSLILFEEVDVIFEEDAGFLNAIKTFMATTKRPVILTTSDPTFSLMFDGCFEEINFNTPSLLNVASYLQTICLTENFRTDVKDFVTLLTANTCDIRKSILYLQFWIRSGGGFLEEKPLSFCRGNGRNVQLVCCEDGSDSKNNPKNTKRNPAHLPKCDTGCAETLFGLKNIFSPSEDLFSFLKHKIRTKEEWHKLIQLLTEFQLRNVDFLYSNLEFILPLPVDIIPETENRCDSSVSVDTGAATKNMKCLPRKHSEREKPLKKSQKKKHKKKMVILDDSDLFDTGLDFTDEFLCLYPASSSSNSEESKAKESNPETKKLNKETNIGHIPCPPKTPAEKKCSALVSHCLNSLTEFMDNMSFLDALLTDVREQKELGKNDFSWTNGKVKSGLCDEFSLESRDGWTSQSSGELKAAVEALSFTKCSSSISKALETLNSCKKLGRDPTKDLTFYVSQKRNNVYFSQSVANLDCSWKKIAVIESVFSSRSLLNLGNRQASIIEYLPTLRNICRIEKLKEQGKSKRRFLHYLEGIHLNISKETVNTLAAGFP
nr:PREDICTED: ATPase family AAA domain-containing protein 5 [Rhinolophus sinicus]